jgi:hypothetical protein
VAPSKALVLLREPKCAVWMRARRVQDGTISPPGEGGMPRRQRDRREEVLRPLLAAMEGEPVPYSELVEAGRMIAAVLVTHRLP